MISQLGGLLALAPCVSIPMCMDEGIALEAYASWMRGGRVMVLMMTLSGFTHEALY